MNIAGITNVFARLYDLYDPFYLTQQPILVNKCLYHPLFMQNIFPIQ